MANIAILGFGVVGSGVAEVITENLEIIEKRINDKLNIKYILDLRDFPDSPFGHLVTHDFNVCKFIDEIFEISVCCLLVACITTT